MGKRWNEFRRCLLFALLACAFAAPLVAQQQAKDQAETPAPLTARELIALAKDVAKEVEELRGWKFKRDVPTEVYTEDQLREFIEKKVFQQQYGGGRLERVEAFLRMVGLIPADCDLRKTIVDVLLNQVGGFYDDESKSFYMLQREGVGYGPLLTRTLIAHELTHALDDQYVDLGKMINAELSEDEAMAIGALVEGSATALMMRYMLRAMLSGDFDTEEIMQAQLQEMERSEEFFRAPPYFSTLMANYICGMYFINRGKPPVPAMGAQADDEASAGVGDNVLAACADPPRTSEQILHPEKYWDKRRRDEPVLVDEKAVEKLIAPTGLHIVHRNTVGEMLCSILTEDERRELDIVGASFPGYWTNDAAEGWGGDRFFLLAEGADVERAKKALKGLRGVWIIAWDTADDRDEFVDDYELEREIAGRKLLKLGHRGAVYFFGFSETAQRELAGRFEKRPPRFTKGGDRWTP